MFLHSGEEFTPPTLAPRTEKSGVCLKNYGVDYVGDLDVSLGGHTCLDWLSPEAVFLSKNKDFTPDFILHCNKCRNPDNDPEGPWCYVEINGNVTMDYCDLELCGKCDSRRTAEHQSWEY